jgi:hypothetical protein
MSEIEIVFDPKWEAACAGLAMDQDHELMPDGDWIRFARRVTGIPDLFMYRHRRTEKFVLAKWLFKPDVCLELEVFDVAPDRGGWMSAEQLKARCVPVHETQKAIADNMRKASSDRKSMMQDHSHEKAQAIKSMRRRGQDREAYMVENGYTPWVGESKGGESYRQTCEMLKNLAKAT